MRGFLSGYVPRTSGAILEAVVDPARHSAILGLVGASRTIPTYAVQPFLPVE